MTLSGWNPRTSSGGATRGWLQNAVDRLFMEWISQDLLNVLSDSYEILIAMLLSISIFAFIFVDIMD
ncbi:MAG: hypothetical protein ACYCR7_08610 [Thermoplasmataceae archaeon]